MFLPSYFIPEWNIMDEIQPSNIYMDLKKDINNFQHDPLKYAAKLLDSLELGHLLHPRTLVADHIQFLSIPVSEDSDCLHSMADMQSLTKTTTLGSDENTMFKIHRKEKYFFRKIFQTCHENPETILRPNTFKRAPCTILAAQTSWLKEIDIQIKLDFIKLIGGQKDPWQTKEVDSNSYELSSFVLLVFRQIEKQRYEQAIDDLSRVISQDEFRLNKIRLLISEFAGHESIFNRTTFNAIRERTYISTNPTLLSFQLRFCFTTCCPNATNISATNTTLNCV